jgi:hypothetical protein
MLQYVTTFESVQFATIVGFGVICVVAMVLRGHKQDAQRKSDDIRFQASQQIELAYANQLKLAQDSHNKRARAGKNADQ